MKPNCDYNAALNIMKYILIADGGATKADWILIDSEGHNVCAFTTDGANPVTSGTTALAGLARQAAVQLPKNIKADEVHYYGAGCATPEICSKVTEELKAVFPQSEVSVASDLLGAARSLLGTSSGIACILGTGSNSCRYDGEKIIGNTPSLGFILGDEGSGAALGKRLVSDAFKGHLPQSVREIFLDRYQLSMGDILAKVYREPAPNKFLASLVPFISEHLWNPYVYAMVRREFDSFLKRNVSPYPDSRSVPISFTGSIAFHFSDILRKAATDAGYTVGIISSRPIEGLAEYHLKTTKKN